MTIFFLFFLFLILPGCSLRCYHLFSHEAQGQNVLNSLTVGMGFHCLYVPSVTQAMGGSYSDLINTSASIISELWKWTTVCISTSAPAGTQSVTISRPRQTHEPLDYASSSKNISLGIPLTYPTTFHNFDVHHSEYELVELNPSSEGEILICWCIIWINDVEIGSLYKLAYLLKSFWLTIPFCINFHFVGDWSLCFHGDIWYPSWLCRGKNQNSTT